MKMKLFAMLAVLISMVGMAAAATPVVELDETDFSYSGTPQMFDVDVYDYPTYVEWVVVIDPSIAPISSATGVQLAIADGTAPRFIVGVMPGEGGIDYKMPAYKPYSGGWGAATNTLPAGMSVTGNNADLTKATEFSIKIDKPVFECEAFGWAMNVVIDDDAPGYAEQYKYPVGWGWSSPACDYEVIRITCQQEIPEFPTMVLPVAAILGLAFLFQRRKE